MNRLDMCSKLPFHEENNIFSRKHTEAEDCLMNCYHLDHNTTVSIRSYFDRLLNNPKYHSVINAFLEKSRNLGIQFSNNLCCELLADDAVLKAPHWHIVLFENEHIRILSGVVKCGECVPFHIHQWDRLMVVLQGAQFKTENIHGAIEFDDIPIGVYELQAERADKVPEESINIGSTVFESIVFEFKK